MSARLFGSIVGTAVCLLAVTGADAATFAQPRVERARPSKAPTTPLTSARTIYLINEGPAPSTEKTFRELRRELQRWGHFDIVNKADRADLTVSLGTTPSLTVRQRKTGATVWATTGGTVPVMLQRLAKEVPPPPTVCFAIWCR